MPPKRRAATASPKKGAPQEHVMDDIESDEGVPVEGPIAAPPTSPGAKRRKEEMAGEGNEADEDAPDGPPVLDEGDDMEEIIVTGEEEGEDASAPTLVKQEGIAAPAAAAAAPPPQPRVAPTAKVGVVAATIGLPAKDPAIGNRRFPRLNMETECLSADVKAAHSIEDAIERDPDGQSSRARERKAPARRPPVASSPARTRAFTSVATLTAVMAESKQRLKKKSGLVKKEDEPDTEQLDEEEVDVETDGAVRDAARDAAVAAAAAGGSVVEAEEDNACSSCGLQFPLKLEMIEHQMAHHRSEFKHIRRGGGILECAHPHCGLALHGMTEQLAHLAGYHNQTNFRIRQRQFASEEAFMAWKTESESQAKSNYIARNEEIEIEPGVTELELYCECSEEWRNADKSKGMAAMLACPAHFTVRLDRNKDKVSIIGCTVHLGHRKKPNWNVYVHADEEAASSRRATGTAQKQSKCFLCGEWFRSRTALTMHRRAAHPDKIRNPTIACGDEHCDVIVDTMHALCEHVADVHKRDDVAPEQYRFNSINDFEVWKERMEADTMSYFTKVSGRQRAATSGPNSECFFRYYQCHLSGYNQRPGGKKSQDEMERVKIRNRGTKKMNRYCTAYMNIKINDGDGSVILKGCLGHFGHECDIRRVPMPNSLRAEIVDLLQKGVTEDDVLTIIKSKASVHDRAYYLQKYEVKNIVKKLIKESNGSIFYKYDDDDVMGVEDETADWQEMKRPFQSTMYRSMMNHPKRRSLGSYAMQFSAQLPRKRRLVYPQAQVDEHNPDGEEYYESVVEEMTGDEHVTYLDEADLVPSSSSHHRHHMVHHHEGHEEHSEESGEVLEQHEMQDELEASTSGAPMLHQRKQQQQPGVQMRTPLLKDALAHATSNRQLEFAINDIRRKIMIMTEQVKRCKDPEVSAQMLEEVRMLEQRMARIIPQTGPGNRTLEQVQSTYVRRRGTRVAAAAAAQQDEEEYYEELVVDDNGYYEVDDVRPGSSQMLVPGHRAYATEVIYEDDGSPVEVDVEDLEEIVEGDVIEEQIDV